MRARISALYLLHLIVPLLVVGDALTAWRHDDFGRFEQAALAVAGTWLAVGSGVFLIPSLRRRVMPMLPKIILVVYSSLVSLAAVDLLAARIFPDPQDHRVYLRAPGLRAVSHASPETMPGVDATANFSVNRWGLRGPDQGPEAGAYRVITVGGSTTECLYLDDSQEWPRLVMDGLNRTGGTPATWLENAGFSGHTAVHHLAMLKTLRALDNADAWIFMPGINDFQDTLARSGAPTQQALEQTVDRLLNGTGMRLSQARLVLPLRRTVVNVEGTPQVGMSGESWYGQNRTKRAGAPILPLPDLRIGLAEYRERILQIGAECQARGKRCLFLTQPTMWRADLPPELAKLMWFGWIGPMKNPRGFASIEDLARGMKQYNDVLLDVCREAGTECLDLDAAIPKDTRAMFDDCHFNSSGARLVADVITQYLRSRPPFASGPSRDVRH